MLFSPWPRNGGSDGRLGNLPFRSPSALWTWRKLITRSPEAFFWGVLWECGVPGLLLWAIPSLYEYSKSCVRIIINIKSSVFSVGVVAKPAPLFSSREY